MPAIVSFIWHLTEGLSQDNKIRENVNDVRIVKETNHNHFLQIIWFVCRKCKITYNLLELINKLSLWDKKLLYIKIFYICNELRNILMSNHTQKVKFLEITLLKYM